MTHAAMSEPWQMWLADFGSPTGSEEGGTRPAVIVDSEDHCWFPIPLGTRGDQSGNIDTHTERHSRNELTGDRWGIDVSDIR